MLEGKKEGRNEGRKGWRERRKGEKGERKDARRLTRQKDRERETARDRIGRLANHPAHLVPRQNDIESHTDFPLALPWTPYHLTLQGHKEMLELLSFNSCI